MTSYSPKSHRNAEKNVYQVLSTDAIKKGISLRICEIGSPNYPRGTKGRLEPVN